MVLESVQETRETMKKPPKHSWPEDTKEQLRMNKGETKTHREQNAGGPVPEKILGSLGEKAGPPGLSIGTCSGRCQEATDLKKDVELRRVWGRVREWVKG